MPSNPVPGQDPHGYATEGTRRAWTYLYRQLWLMRYPTGALVLAMCGYTIMSKAWIPFLDANMISILLWFMWWWMGISTLKRLCIGSVQMEKTQHIMLEKVYKHIGYMGWMMWFLSVIGTYWAIVIFWASYIMPEG